MPIRKITYCMSFAPDNAPRSTLARVTTTLSAEFEFLDARNGRKEGLRAARFLLLVLSSPEDLSNRAVTDDWEFFLNEIRWKRKTDGEIVMLVPENFDFSRIPFRLKNVVYFTFGEESALNQYLLEQVSSAQTTATAEAEAVPDVKQIVYTPRPPAVQQIEFSARAPSIPSFDGTVKIGNEHAYSGCKEDHIYGSQAQSARENAKTYRPPQSVRTQVDTDFSNGSGVYESSTNKKVKKKGTGCIVGIVVLVLLGVAAFIIGGVLAGIIGNVSAMSALHSASVPLLRTAAVPLAAKGAALLPAVFL